MKKIFVKNICKDCSNFSYFPLLRYRAMSVCCRPWPRAVTEAAAVRIYIFPETDGEEDHHPEVEAAEVTPSSSSSGHSRTSGALSCSGVSCNRAASRGSSASGSLATMRGRWGVSRSRDSCLTEWKVVITAVFTTLKQDLKLFPVTANGSEGHL